MDQDEFRARQPGENAEDAALQENDQEEAESEEKDVVEDAAPGEKEEGVEASEETEEEDLPELPEKEKTAFEKRMERERTKAEEKIRAELSQEYEQKYGKHKQVIDLLGGDPDAIEQRIRENQVAAEAQKLAEANGWDEQETQWYINQRKQEQELKELRVQMQINKLRDNPEYAGIGSLEKEIVAKIDRSNGALSVEEAYWALGGPKRIEQIRLEAQMRESEKRKKQPRTVLTDAPTPNTSEKPLPPDVLRDAERMGISAAEARRLMAKEPAGDIEEYRKRKQQAK